MYNTHYNETLKNWKTVKKSLTKENYNVQFAKFKIEYNKSTWAGFYVIMNKKYTLTFFNN